MEIIMLGESYERNEEEWLELLHQDGGYYRCPKGPDGKRLGLLAGYAGKYKTDSGEELQYVGDEYANFAKIECNASHLREVAEALGRLIRMLSFDFGRAGFVGMPMGGLKLSGALAVFNDVDDIYPEIVVDELKTKTSRQKSHLQFERHLPDGGQNYIIVEDVCNNFSTTDKGIELVEGYYARVIGIACFLNRSPVHRTMYPYKGRRIPIIPLVNRAIPEYHQDDPFVAADVVAGNVAWKPKNKDDWQRLMEAMSATEAT